MHIYIYIYVCVCVCVYKIVFTFTFDQFNASLLYKTNCIILFKKNLSGRHSYNYPFNI